MKSLLCVALAAGLTIAPPISAATSSAEYQALIREATERYRGDFVSGYTIVTAGFIYYEIDPLYKRSAVPDHLPPGTFAVALSLKEDPAMALSPAPNQTLQLTTTAPRPETIFDDLLPPPVISVRYR